jgi:photosynthetic reaction center cytochrome c subunit
MSRSLGTGRSGNRARGPRVWGRWVLALVLGASVLMAGCERTDTVQRGYRGLSMTQLFKPSELAKTASLHSIPEPEASDPPDPEAPAIKDVFKNVQVLNDLTVLEFSRLMQAMSTWVACCR